LGVFFWRCSSFTILFHKELLDADLAAKVRLLSKIGNAETTLSEGLLNLVLSALKKGTGL
jgi:hypothetical protein